MGLGVEWMGNILKYEHIQALINSDSSLVSRFCFHECEESALHVMLISMPPNSNYPIHRHFSSDEWYTAIHGSLFISKYDCGGKKTDTILLQPPSKINSGTLSSSGLLMQHNIFHDAKTLDDGAIFLEVRPGPFNKADTQYLKDLL